MAGVDMIDIVDETARLLSGMTFSTERGGVAHSERVQVIVDPRWDADRSRFRVAVHCCAVGFDGGPWGGMPVVIERLGDDGAAAAESVAGAPAGGLAAAGGGLGVAGSNRPAAAPARAAQTFGYAYRYAAPASAASSASLQPGFVAMLNARGHAAFENVPAGAYRLFASPCWAQAEPMDSGAPVPAAQDERLRAAFTRTDDGALRVTAQTGDPALAGATVRCVLVDPARRVCARGEFTLAPGSAGSWTGSWTQAEAPVEAHRLVCQAFIAT